MSRQATVALLAALAASACGTDVVEGSAVASAVCADEELPRLQEGSHLIGGAEPPVPYSSNPPTSGWHSAGAVPSGVHAEPLTDPQIVSILEAGQVVIAYDPSRLTGEEVGAIEELGTVGFPQRLSVTPRGQDDPVVLTGWGVLRRCDEFDESATVDFVLRHAGEAMDH